MEAKDLMIGDYVQIKVLRMNKVFEKEAVMMPYKVIEVREKLVLERINIMNDDDRYTTIFTSNIVEPIPLTKKILEKNGFKKCNVDDDGAVQYEFGDDNLGIDLWVSRPCLLGAWRKWKGMEKSYNMINEFPIRYVHELQHALRLCGIEKEIII